MVQLLELEVVDVPQDELPPGLPVLLALPVTSIRLHLVGQSSVLLDKILHVHVGHLAPLRPSQQRFNFLSAKRVPEVVFQLSVFQTAPHSGGAERYNWPEIPSARRLL